MFRVRTAIQISATFAEFCEVNRVALVRGRSVRKVWS